ncbi:MAG: DUF1963 domain-containing protein [Planctomycetales bacterium]|nr:DUF1963 domain-containing protein [Planctomycetales bacterium]
MDEALENFDPGVWCCFTAELEAPMPSAGMIVGPTDVMNLLEARRQLRKQGFHFGNPVPMDVFIHSVGESQSRSQTKFGGLPYWPLHETWPCGSTGRPLPFVGQFDFRGSLDIVGESVENDLLLIFGALPSADCDPEILLIWRSATNNEELVTSADVPCSNAFGPFSCTRWRTSSYPDAEIEEYQDALFGDENYIDPSYACDLLATQIGMAPFTLAEKPPSLNKKYLCCCAPILPATDRRYPFLNFREPLLTIHGTNYLYADRFNYVDQWSSLGDSTSLYFFRDKAGHLRSEMILG